MTRLAEGSLGIREDLGGRDREHRDRLTTFTVKGTAAHLVLPSSIPLGSPRLGEAFEHVIVSDLDGVALDYDVETRVPVVAASR